MGTEGDRGEVAETIDVRVAGHGRKRAPREGPRVKEEGRGNGRILREKAKKVRHARRWEESSTEGD